MRHDDSFQMIANLQREDGGPEESKEKVVHEDAAKFMGTFGNMDYNLVSQVGETVVETTIEGEETEQIAQF